jgi:hypothetical protein
MKPTQQKKINKKPTNKKKHHKDIPKKNKDCSNSNFQPTEEEFCSSGSHFRRRGSSFNFGSIFFG